MAAWQPDPTDLLHLEDFKKFGRFTPGYPPNVRRFFAPEDDVHGVILAVLRSTSMSVAAAMYGYDDDDVNTMLLQIAEDPRIPVQLCLDKSQAGGVHERKLIAEWPVGVIGNRLVIGESSKHAISHTKLIVVDGMFTIGGSTNLSLSGEEKQNNELVVVQDAVYAAESRAKIDLTHDEMVRQAGGK